MQHNKSRALKMQRDQFSEFHATWAEPIEKFRNLCFVFMQTRENINSKAQEV